MLKPTPSTMPATSSRCALTKTPTTSTRRRRPATMRAASAGSHARGEPGQRMHPTAQAPRSAAIVASSSDVTPQTLMRGTRDMPLASYEGLGGAGRRALAERDRDLGAVGAAHQRDLHLVARLAARDGVDDVLVAAHVAAGDLRDDVAAELDRRAVERRRDVARMDPGLLGRAAGRDRLHERAMADGQVQALEGLVDRQRAHAQEAAVHAAGLLQLGDDLLGGVDRDREADAEVAARAAAAAGLDLRVDADHAAGAVDQ